MSPFYSVPACRALLTVLESDKLVLASATSIRACRPEETIESITGCETPVLGTVSVTHDERDPVTLPASRLFPRADPRLGQEEWLEMGNLTSETGTWAWRQYGGPDWVPCTSYEWHWGYTTEAGDSPAKPVKLYNEVVCPVLLPVGCAFRANLIAVVKRRIESLELPPVCAAA